jgi:sugar phosphate permease
MGVNWQGIFIYPALVLTLILIWSWLASRAAPADVIPGAIVSEAAPGADGKPAARPQLANYGADENPTVRVILTTLLSMPIYRQLLVFSFLTTLLRSVFFFWTPKFLFDTGLSASAAILQSAIFPLLGVLGTLFIGWYTDHHAHNGDRARMMWMMLSMLVFCMLAIAMLSAAADPNFTLIMVFLGASGFFLLGPYSMSSGCLTLDIAGAKGAGSCTGIIDGMGYIGGALAAFAAGAMSDYLGWPQVFFVLSVFAVISTVSAWFMSRGFQRIARENAY